MENQIKTLEKRLSRLERLNRWLTGMLCLLTIGGVMMTALLFNGQQTTLQVEKIELVDADGLVRAVLQTKSTNETGFWIYDKNGEERIALSDGEEGSALYLKDSAGDTRVGVAQFSHGGGGFALHGEKGVGASVLYHKGKGSLSFYGDSSDVLYRVP